MASPSARKLKTADYHFVQAALNDLVRKLQARGHKVIHQRLDVATAMRSLYDFEHAYIVADSFLVVFDVSQPWYSKDVFLHELLVLRLMGSADFQVVTDFLEASAREAGASMVAAGTALARSDRALASLYSKQGYVEAALALVKEI